MIPVGLDQSGLRTSDKKLTGFLNQIRKQHADGLEFTTLIVP